MSCCEGSIVRRSTKVCYPHGLAAVVLIPRWWLQGCFWRDPLAVLHGIFYADAER